MRNFTIKKLYNDRDYLVVIDGDVDTDCYEMSADANMPNGVCVYLGQGIEKAYEVEHAPVTMVPIGIVKQIANLLQRE